MFVILESLNLYLILKLPYTHKKYQILTQKKRRNYYKKTGNYGHIITLKTEHKAVLEPLNQLKKEGFMVTEINPEKDGLISEEQFKKNIKEDTFLVSVMLANNEIGVIQPIENISKICK